MKTRFLSLAAVAAAAALLSPAVQAQTVRNFALGDISNATTPLSNTVPTTGAFLDIYQFSVSGAGVAFGGAVNFPVDDPAGGDVEFSFDIVGVSLLDGLGGLLASDGDGSDGFAVGAGLLAAGDYQFAVLGLTSVGAIAGAYSGVIVTEVAPAIPEPQTYALMAAGLGVLALVARRRRRG